MRRGRRFARALCLLPALATIACGDPRGAALRTMTSAIARGTLASVSAETAGAHPDHAAAHASPRATSRPVTRTYYLAADPVDWDYAPTGINQIANRPFNDEEKRPMVAGPTTIGRQLKKARYREYTDDTFTMLKPRPPAWEHLGLLGPVIRAEVGDTIRVVFRNNAPFKASVHPHNVLYDKRSEGALYNDGSSGDDKLDDAVPTGGTYTYTWQVPERAGPTAHEGSSTIAMYHSHSDEVRDVAAGLIGPMIITKRGMARPDGSPVDVDREFVTDFMEVDEAHSWFLDENIRKNVPDPSKLTIRSGAFFNMLVLPDWDSFYKETINGYSYGHTPGLRMKVGEHVRWYMMSGTDAEWHTPHWHGNVVEVNHMRMDMLSLVAMEMAVADMVPDNPGRWLLHCHVSIHQKAGMQAFYVVDPAGRDATR